MTSYTFLTQGCASQPLSFGGILGNFKFAWANLAERVRIHQSGIRLKLLATLKWLGLEATVSLVDEYGLRGLDGRIVNRALGSNISLEVEENPVRRNAFKMLPRP